MELVKSHNASLRYLGLMDQYEHCPSSYYSPTLSFASF